MTDRLPSAKWCHGFTLTEMAVVLVIVALLVGGMLVPLAARQDIRNVTQTEETLRNIHEALLGFAASRGRLPCPATATSQGRESFAAGGGETNGQCANFFDGFLPAADLGIRPTDNAGFAIDAWGRRIHYAIPNATINGTANALTRTDGMRMATMGSVANATMLSVCATATGITAGQCATSARLTSNAPAVIFSLGKNGAGSGTDEQANSAVVDAAFVSRTPTPPGAPGGEFDDLVDWLSINVLFNRMITAGRLP